MEIEVETDEIYSKEKSITKLFSKKKKPPEKEVKKIKTKTKPVTKTGDLPAGKRKLGVFVFVSSLALASIFLGYFSHDYYNKHKEVRKNQIFSVRDEKQLMVDNVSRSMELPGEESPIVMSVVDAEKIREQSFFPEAKEDDQMIIYVEAKKAIIYRLSSEKIVDIIPFLEKEEARLVEQEQKQVSNQIVVANVGADNGVEKVLAETDAQVQKEEKKIRLAVYNGTKTKGVSEKLAEVISAANANAEVVIKANAKGTYEKTIVLDLVGNNTELAASIAGVIGGDVSTSFPQGEPMPEADILIIGGGK